MSDRVQLYHLATSAFPRKRYQGTVRNESAALGR